MESIGYFTVESGKLYFSDPCYDYQEPVGMDDLTAACENAAIGVWQGFVRMTEQGGWGNRVAELLAFNLDSINTRFPDAVERMVEYSWKRIARNCGVDSGQFGIFDDVSYPRGDRDGQGEFNKDEFYDQCCNITLGTYALPDRVKDYLNKNLDRRFRLSSRQAGVVNPGVGIVSSSGFGDGSYPVYVYEQEGKVVGVRVVFIGDEEEETDECDE